MVGGSVLVINIDFAEQPQCTGSTACLLLSISMKRVVPLILPCSYHWKAMVSTHITWATVPMIYLLLIFNPKLARL